MTVGVEKRITNNVGGEKLFKQIKKAENSDKYEDAVAEIFDTLPIREHANWE